jgi:hypothetical protein
MKEQRSARK